MRKKSIPAKNVVSDLLGKAPKKINSKAKGSSNERRAALWLLAWTGVKFERTPASGGLRWLDASRIAGDVVAPSDFDFKFCVEVKSREKIDITGSLKRSNANVYKFWEQASNDAKRVNRIPMLMMRENGMGKEDFYIGFPKSMVNSVLPLKLIEVIAKGVPEDCDYEEFIIFASQDVLKTVKYADLISYLT